MNIYEELEKKENPLETNYERIWYPRKRAVKAISSCREELIKHFCYCSPALLEITGKKCEDCIKINDILGESK